MNYNKNVEKGRKVLYNYNAKFKEKKFEKSKIFFFKRYAFRLWYDIIKSYIYIYYLENF